MIRLNILVLLLVAVIYNSNAQLNIIPKPNEVELKSGKFNIRDGIKIVKQAKTAQIKKIYQSFADQHQSKIGKTNELVLNELANDTEAYSIDVSSKKIIVSGSEKGLFYALQTLLQLIADNQDKEGNISCLSIKDKPRFEHRGFMLDVARHFRPIEHIKEVIDAMAHYKLNTFHWHLTDTHGWRIEIKKYPKLTELGAWRDFNVAVTYNILNGIDLYGGYYTQEEIKDVVKYAEEKFITIIPEIDIPGHSGAALRAYPEHRVTLAEEKEHYWHSNILFSPRDKTIAFLEDVFSEIIELFPSQYIHIGGDEVNLNPWKDSPEVQDIMKKNNVRTEKDMESYFIHRIAKFIESKGRNIIGWDEIATKDIYKGAKIMSWRGDVDVFKPARMGHYMIMCPNTKGMYFDQSQSTSSQEPRNFSEFSGRHFTLKETYSYEPAPNSLPAALRKYISGVQGNMWTELIDTYPKLQYMIYPRLYALSEIAWTDPDLKDYSSFRKRVNTKLSHLDAEGTAYRVPDSFSAIDTTIIVNDTYKVELEIPAQFEGAKVYYTINEDNPGILSNEYKAPFLIKVNENQTRWVKSVMVTPSGRESLVSTIKLINPGINKGSSKQVDKKGVKYRIFSASLPSTLIEVGQLNTLDIRALAAKHKNSKIELTTYLKVKKNGVYQIGLSSNQPSILYVNGKEVIDNSVVNNMFFRTEALLLDASNHQLKVIYDNSKSKPYHFKINSNIFNSGIEILNPNNLFIDNDQK